jgi:DNA helicase-2/ATP-dependent DNA helicase PcrA
MVPGLESDGKIHWPEQYWQMLGAFGQLVEAGGQDDLEVEAFSEGAVAMLTFHQAKGLEFDHVYVAMTGKEPDPCAALATELFSGRTPKYVVVDGTPKTNDKTILALAEADREREVYVAITRPKEKLSILHGIGDGGWAMDLNNGLAALFAGAAGRQQGSIEIKEWKP